MIERIAHAKINLALHVTGQREDGYHLLDTLVVFANLGDVIRFEKPHHAHGPIEVHVDGRFGDNLPCGGENLVTNAAVILRESLKNTEADLQPVAIRLTKHLPVASGIGGGSADAAAALLGLQQYWKGNQDLVPLAKVIGADVPMCLHSKPLRAQGIGDEVSLLEMPDPLNIVLVNPGVEVGTPEVFKQLTEKNQTPVSQQKLTRFPDIEELKTLRNDLQEPAVSLHPVIGDVLDQISESGAELARLSGSGATCFGIYPTIEAAEQACRTINQNNPDWWCIATTTTVS